MGGPIWVESEPGKGSAFHDRAPKIGSAQEFEGTRILGCFPENHEFGSGGGR
jgi:hypothetical protein